MPEESSFLLDFANFLFRNNKDYLLAEVLYKNAVKYAPDSYLAHFYYAIFLLTAKKDRHNGVRFLIKALENEYLDSNHKAFICINLVHFEKNIDAALKAYATLTLDEKITVEHAETFSIIRDYGVIEQNLLTKLEKAPSNPVLLLRLAYHYLSVQKNRDKAYEFYKRVPNVLDNNLIKDVRTARALLLCEFDQKYEEAIRILSAAEAESDGNSHLIVLGIIYKNYLSDFSQADFFYKKYLQIGPENDPYIEEFVAYANLADLYFIFGRHEEGEGFLDEAFALTTCSDNQLCLWFYRFIYLEKYRDEAFLKITDLLDAGVRKPNWEFRYNIIRLEGQNNPDFPLIKRFAKKITQYHESPVWYKIEDD